MVAHCHWPRLPINFDNSSVVFVLYPWGAGGKFVINSLTVSSGAVLQDDGLAQQQLYQELTSKQKQQMVLQRLAQETGRWRDLQFSIDALTGINERYYINEPASTAQYWPWNNVINELCCSGIKWFIDIHDAGHLQAALAVWPNAKIIRFSNTENFLKWRRVNYSQAALQQWWHTVRDHNWPEQAPSDWQEFCQLPLDIQQELILVRHGDIFKYIQHPAAEQFCKQARKQREDQVCSGFEVFEFDGNTLLDTNQYLESIEKCYAWNDLTDFDKTFIECYHKQWLEKIQQVPI
jgi:hypothetical protein